MITPDLVANCFEGFSPSDRVLSDMLRSALEFCAAMCSADRPAYWLTLVGPSGTGKTMMAKGIVRLFRRHMADRLLDENRSGPQRLFRRNGGLLEWPKMIDRMLQGDYGFMRQACDDWLVALDDVGAEHTKLQELSASKLFTILNARQGKFTVLTANLGVQEIAEKLDPRIASRLLRNGGKVIDTTGTPDWNIRISENEQHR